MRSRRGLRLQHEHGVPPAKENQRTRAPLSFEVCRLRSRHCAWGDSFELVRAFREHSCVLLGVAGEMRPTDFCTPKHFKLEHPGFAVSQRCDRSRRSLAASPRADHTRPEPCGSCSFTRNVFLSRSPSLVRRRARSAPPGSGPFGANEAGEYRGSQRDTRFDDHASAARGAFSSPRRRRHVRL